MRHDRRAPVAATARPARLASRARRRRCAMRSTGSPPPRACGWPTRRSFCRSTAACAWSTGPSPAGTALTELLGGVAVEPVVTDSDRVVLAPPTSAPERRRLLQRPRGRDEPASSSVSSSPARSTARRSARSPSLSMSSTAASCERRDARLPVQRPRRRGPRCLDLGAIADEPARSLCEHSRRELVRPELSQGLHRRHRGRELAPRHGSSMSSRSTTSKSSADRRARRSTAPTRSAA